jgi:hypothetical protein
MSSGSCVAPRKRRVKDGFGSLADAATMSALSPVCPEKRTSTHVSAGSESCQKQTSQCQKQISMEADTPDIRIPLAWSL